MNRSLAILICIALIATSSVETAAADDPTPASPPATSPSDAPSSEATLPAEASGSAEAAPPAGIGIVKGSVLDGGTELGLAVATIQVLGGQSIATEIDGTYTLSLAPGTYTIVFSTPEYVEQRRVITIAESQALALDVVLAPVPKTGAAETIEVYSAIDTRTDSAVLAARRVSATVSDALSAQQIARSPDSNASDAAKRMVAATIQDNRYIVIRGLGGRYSTTLLNGVPLPSPDPDIPAAPLDLFPAALITNLTVNKTFAPDMPGNFAGGALGIETRNYPTKFLFKAKVGIAGNSTTSFRTLNGQDGGSLDLLGYDDGSRSLPSGIPADQLAGGDQLSAAQRDAQMAAFKNDWSIDRGMVGPNLTGTDDSTAVVDRTRLQFLQRELLFTQLVGDDHLADKVILTWQANVARVAQHEPDTRDLQRTQTGDGRFAISTSAGSSERLFGELTDNTIGGAAAVRMPFEAVKLETGASIQRSTRDYQARRFHFNLIGDSVFLPPNQAFAPENAGNQMSMSEVTLPSDGYTATRTVTGFYAMADANPTTKLRLVGGARLELSNLDLGLDATLDPETRVMPRTTRDDLDALPSLNAVYAITPSTNLRAAYAMTVARPNFREIAPALYYDYVRRRVIGGNPDLVETHIHNGDLRWETFRSSAIASCSRPACSPSTSPSRSKEPSRTPAPATMSDSRTRPARRALAGAVGWSVRLLRGRLRFLL